MLAGFYDYRSDTITQPTEAMREAMRHARVGDDGRGDDPTVKELEALAAQLLGKEAALLVTSGTQGNLVSLLAHERRGCEAIVEASAHLYRLEAGGLCVLAGLVPRPLPGQRGVLSPEQVEEAINPSRPLLAPSGLLCLENTHNDAGGTVWTPTQLAAVADVARRHGLAVHLDGARLFNAAVALGVSVAELAAPADSVTFCLSKGLSAPIGSLVCGSRAFIEKARRARQMVGGTLRQAGVIAAAGLVALQQQVERLAEDHRLARQLAEGLARLSGLRVDLASVQTNIVQVDVSAVGDARLLVAELEREQVRVLAPDRRRVRFVTHRHVAPEDIQPTLAAVARAVARLQNRSASA